MANEEEGPGTPKDASDALLKAAIDWEAPAAGDPKVSKAFALGWRVALVAQEGDIEGFGLKGGAFRDVLLAQVNAAAKELLPENPPVLEAAAAAAFADTLVGALVVLDPVYGRACRLGADMQTFCRQTSVDKPKLQALRKDLGVLATKFPPYAAHSVMNSLTLWECETAAGDRLGRQGDVWRPLLAGETAPKDLLHLSDYIGTAQSVISRLDDVARQAFRGRLRWLTVAAVALFIGGVLVLVVADTTGTDLAGLSGVVAAFGLTWKGIGGYLGRSAAKAERSLWDAQLNWAIAYRTTIGDFSPPPETLTRAANHKAEWETWRTKWPDSELDA